MAFTLHLKAQDSNRKPTLYLNWVRWLAVLESDPSEASLSSETWVEASQTLNLFLQFEPSNGDTHATQLQGANAVTSLSSSEAQYPASGNSTTMLSHDAVTNTHPHFLSCQKTCLWCGLNTTILAKHLEGPKVLPTVWWKTQRSWEAQYSGLLASGLRKKDSGKTKGYMGKGLSSWLSHQL